MRLSNRSMGNVSHQGSRGEHMTDLMAIARLLSVGLTEAEVMQAKLKAED